MGIKKLSSDKDVFLNILFFLGITAALLLRLQLITCATMMIDSDQPFLWLGAKDFSEGHFYEPRFYGQDYNTFMESLFSVPLLWKGIPVYYALPAVTHFLTLFPFLFTASYLFAANKKMNAIVVVFCLLLQTPAFDILTAIPRGFVTGLFFCSFFVLSVLNPRHLGYFFLNGLLLLTGVFVNPNCLIVGVPFLTYMFLVNYKDHRFYKTLFVFIPFYLLLYLVFDKFYDDHPEYIIYKFQNIFSPKFFWLNIERLDHTFCHVNFFEEDKCIWLFLVLAILSVVLFRENKKLFYSLMILLVFVTMTLFAGKTREGSTWPFYSFSRMYLGLPFAIALLFSAIRIPKHFISIVAGFVLLIYPTRKLATQSENLAYHLQDSHYIGVHLVPLHVAADAIKVYRGFCKKNNADYLIVSNIFWLTTFLAYGGSSFYTDFPQTRETVSDHRYWVWHENRDKVYDRFMVLSINNKFGDLVRGKYPFEIEKLDDFGLFLVTNNRLKNQEFIDILKDHED